WAQFIAPSDPLITDAPHAEVSLRAWTEPPAQPLEVRGSHALYPPQPAEVEGDVGEDQRFHFPVDLLHGRNEIQAVLRTTDGEQRRTASYILNYQGDAPGLLLTSIIGKQGDTCPQ